MTLCCRVICSNKEILWYLWSSGHLPSLRVFGIDHQHRRSLSLWRCYLPSRRRVPDCRSTLDRDGWRTLPSSLVERKCVQHSNADVIRVVTRVRIELRCLHQVFWASSSEELISLWSFKITSPITFWSSQLAWTQDDVWCVCSAAPRRRLSHDNRSWRRRWESAGTDDVIIRFATSRYSNGIDKKPKYGLDHRYIITRWHVDYTTLWPGLMH